MLLFWLAAISASQIPTASEKGPTDLPPGMKQCPGPRRVRVTESCPFPPQLPNHRYLLTHEPRRQIVSAEWWCQGEPSPTSVRFSVKQRDTPNAASQITGPTHSVSLFSLRVSGRAASTAQLSRVRQSLQPFSNIGVVHGRCLHTESGRAIPVLTFVGYTQGIMAPQNVELELR
jgi:hypothetical protein